MSTTNINHQLKAIFIHIPKNAGTSIKRLLSMNHAHWTLEQTKATYGVEWDTYYKFAVVRDPIERLISTYEFSQMDKSYYHDNLNPSPDGIHGDRHCDYELVKGKSLDDCLRLLLADPTALKQPGWLPQSHFLSNPEAVDFVARHERIAADWQTIAKGLGIGLELPRINESAKIGERRDYYTPFVCAAASRLYRRDYMLFGYPLP